jgi:periplasmic divalent cation tolerance protein
MDAYILVISTVPDRETGSNIGNVLVKSRLAACVNMIPGATSIYEWENEVCTEDELVLFIKTRESLFDKVREKILDIHPYEVPEVISVKIEEGHIPYLRWISENTTMV